MNEPKAVLEAHRAFWRREGRRLVHVAPESPLAPVEILLKGGNAVEEDSYLTPEVLDPRLLLDAEEDRRRIHSDQAGPVSGDLLLTKAPLGKMCWVEAVMGCPVRVRASSGSIYSQPYLDDPRKVGSIPDSRDNGWLDLLVQYTRILVEESKGEYYVTLPLMRGTIDLVAALLGYTKMAEAIYDCPGDLRRLTERCQRTFLEVAEALYGVIPRLEGGHVSPYHVWAPGSLIKTQCDASAAISAKTYEELFFPFEEETCSHYDYSVVHLHSGYLHTVDTFLKGEYPTAIQVGLDTGSTPQTPHTLMPVFRKILERKPLFVTGSCSQSELDEMLSSLPSGGLAILARVATAA